MKHILTLTLALGSLSAFGANIEHNTIQFIRPIFSPQPNGSTERMAAVGGKVDFTGTGPVYVTLTNGGQHYTTPTDSYGNYNFFIWTNGNNIDTWAWVPEQPVNDTPVMPTEPPTLNPAFKAHAEIKR